MKMAVPYEKYKQVGKLLSDDDESSAEKTPRQIILEKYLDMESGILEKLIAIGILKWEETRNLEPHRKQELIVNIFGKHELQCILQEVLQDTHQSHLIGYADDKDYYRRIVEGDVPLMYREETTLDVNHEVLLDLLEDSTGLARLLQSKGVLNRRLMDRVCCTPHSALMSNETLLHILRRRSDRDYKTTMKCLRDLGQIHVADILEYGATGKLFCRIQSQSDNDNICESEIVRFSKELKLCGDTSSESAGSCRNLIKLGLRNVAWSSGIRLYFHFTSTSQLLDLRAKWKSNALREATEDDLAVLLRVPRASVNVDMRWTEYDFQRCLWYFTCVPSNTQVNNLPVELMDSILRKAWLILMLPGNSGDREVDSRVPGDILLSLAFISNLWFEILNKKRAKKTRRRIYNVEVQKMKKRSAIIRNNKEYLRNEIKPDDLISLMLSAGCLTDLQCSYLRALRVDTASHNELMRVRNDELLQIARHFSSEDHFKFVECLRMTRQFSAARVVEIGGATVKVSIRTTKTPTASILEQNFMLKLQNLQPENSQELNELLTRSGFRATVVLGAYQRSGIELWLWCQTQEALSRLRVADDGILFNIVEQLFSKLQPSAISSASLKPKNVTINEGYFKHDVVVRRLSAKLKGSLNLELGNTINGMASLADKIYLLDKKYISMYDYNAPHNKLEKSVKLPELKFQTMLGDLQLVACQVTNCLYVSDPDDDCIWQVDTLNDHHVSCWLSDVVGSNFISVSSNGLVIVLDTSILGHPVLRMYSSDGVLKRNVELPYRLYSLKSGAVEMMPGLLVLSYERAGDGRSFNLEGGILSVSLEEEVKILREVRWSGVSSLATHSVGRVLATADANHSVVLLDHELNRCEVLLTNMGRCMCYRNIEKVLLIMRYGRIDLYRLTYDDEGGT